MKVLDVKNFFPFCTTNTQMKRTKLQDLEGQSCLKRANLYLKTFFPRIQCLLNKSLKQMFTVTSN